MSDYVTPVRGHDAEFLLGIQRASNDRQVQAAKAGRRPVLAKSPVRDVGPIPEITPGEAQAAARFVRRRVEKPAVREVLQMLGLEAS
ncbi:hypothetical protein [Nonomuraea sp. GTA35]|uniref:hypothetical protein n=1 Tax=Nonomuraea sp. GTA35 TaxID=1676746 RepID=UPI0035C25EAE